MRRDEQLGIQDTSVRVSSDRVTPANGGSFSGNERDKLFLSQDARSFADVSGISGLDHPGDGRTSSFLDLDRDGWMDVALASANAPLLQVYRNRVGALQPAPHRFLAVRLVGGNDGPTPDPYVSARDGYGARVRVTVGGRTLTRSHLCGTGFASQNTNVMLIGLGTHGRAERLEVLWPAGTRSLLEDVAAGQLVTAHERTASGLPAFELSPYGPVPESERFDVLSEPHATARAARIELPVPDGSPRPPLRMYTTMATWCASCRRETPYLATLRSALGPSVLGMYAIPIDPEDNGSKLAAYWQRHEPAYELLPELGAERTAAVAERFASELGHDGLPSTMVLNEDGDVLLVRAGIPTLSELRGLLPDGAGTE